MESTSLNDRKIITIETKKSTRTPSLKWLDDAMRRLMDVVGAGIGLLLLSPAFIMIGLAIRHNSPGPIFYRGRRMGKGGKEFGILKFRTMYEEENNHNGAKITAQDDPRITPTGRWLRETKVNELPQLWNVLVGDMSFVGPRPEDPDIVKNWTEEDRQILLSVRPGVTSPATFIYRDEEQLLSSSNVMQEYMNEILPTKLRLDKLYLRNRSITTDLDVMFWTAVTMLPNVRTLAVPQQYLFWGPVSRITMRYLFWLVIDTVIAFLAMGIMGMIWRIGGPLDVGIDRAILYALGISALFSLANWMLGLNRMEWSRAPARNVFKLGLSIVLATGATLVLDSQLPVIEHLPDGMIISSAVLAFAGFTVVRFRERLVTGTGSRWMKARGNRHKVGERVLMVGGGENGALAAWIFDHTALEKAVNLVGMVDDDPCLQGLSIDGYDVLGTTSNIPELVEKHDIGLIVYTINNIQPQQREKILSECYKTGVKVVMLPDIIDIMRNEFRVSGNEEPHSERILEKVAVDRMLGEVQKLLEAKQFEAAQKQLASCREKIQGNSTQGRTAG
jgi:lipopolysaccharide/colanic/teichoic acid biosynthesis glycosyltransferase